MNFEKQYRPHKVNQIEIDKERNPRVEKGAEKTSHKSKTLPSSPKLLINTLYELFFNIIDRNELTIHHLNRTSFA